MDKNWSREEMTFLFESRTKMPVKPYSLIAVELGRSVKSCECKFRETDWDKAGFTVDQASDESRYAYKSQFTGKLINALDKRHDAMRVRADAMVDMFEKAIERLPKVPLPIYKPSKTSKNNTPEDVGLVLSDLHVGHQHTLQETGGLSEYNHEIFLKRMENLKNATTEICELHRTYTKLPTLRVFCLGDIVAGMNAAGAWSPLYIVKPISEQTLEGFEAISKAIHYWLGFFDNIVFYGISGNHGRTAPQGIQKDHDNWDYMVYQFLRVRFENNPRVKFHIPQSWWMMDKIRSHNFLMVHGDYTRNGSPINSLTKFYEKMQGIVPEKPNYVMAGHFHNSAEQTVNGARIILNGSFVGSDVYSLRNIHAASAAEQKIFGIHDKHGITWSYNINLDSERK